MLVICVRFAIALNVGSVGSDSLSGVHNNPSSRSKFQKRTDVTDIFLAGYLLKSNSNFVLKFLSFYVDQQKFNTDSLHESLWII